jgi:hypothetical protein
MVRSVTNRAQLRARDNIGSREVTVLAPRRGKVTSPLAIVREWISSPRVGIKLTTTAGACPGSESACRLAKYRVEVRGPGGGLVRAGNSAGVKPFFGRAMVVIPGVVKRRPPGAPATWGGGGVGTPSGPAGLGRGRSISGVAGIRDHGGLVDAGFEQGFARQSCGI